MGYLTRFVIETDPENDELWEKLRQDDELGEVFIEGRVTAKWYSHERDLKDLSLKYPEVLFTVYGEGEESGDIWRKYFKNGKMQVCKAVITFPEFDEAKME